MPTPVQNNERHRLNDLNGNVTRLGHELKANQDLDRRFHTIKSADTRKNIHDLGDALHTRKQVKKDLEGRMKSSSTSPRDKAHAQELLHKIADAERRERNDQITRRSGTASARELGLDRQGILRVK
ncbi:hypothetical protein L6R52_34450 [Myxococcota bacterium]|nr:hypothetical protein [Myxococcota bacterium]